jgi:hypothetical protein
MIVDISFGPRGRKASITQPSKAKTLIKPNKNVQFIA